MAAEGVRYSRVSCQGPLCMPARASFMTERYVRDHGVYTNSSEIPPDSPTYVLGPAGGRLPHRRCWARRTSTSTSSSPSSHMDDMAGRLEALGFAEVFETGDKFIGKIPTRYTDYLAGQGLLDAYTRHIADRSYQGENEDGQNATKCVPMWDSTPTPIPLASYVDAWHGAQAVQWIERYDRDRAVLPLRGLSRARMTPGTLRRRRWRAYRGRRHLHAALDPAPVDRRDRTLRRPARTPSCGSPTPRR